MIALYEEQIENRIIKKKNPSADAFWNFLRNLLHKDDLIYNAIKTSTRTQIRPHTVILEVILYLWYFGYCVPQVAFSGIDLGGCHL